MRQQIKERIRLCEQRSNYGLWALALFVAISIAANSQFQTLAELAQQWRAIFGPPPPAGWINGALFIYSFSAVIQIFTRMMQGDEPKKVIFPVGYLVLFFFLWHGVQKLFGFPSAMPEGVPAYIIYGAGPIELIGGTLVMIGLFTRPAAFLASGLMAAAYWIAHGTLALLPLQIMANSPPFTASSFFSSPPREAGSGASIWRAEANK